GYGRVADLAHRMANLLDRLRQGRKAPTGELVQLLFRCPDLLGKKIALAVIGRDGPADVSGLGAALAAAPKRLGWGGGGGGGGEGGGGEGGEQKQGPPGSRRRSLRRHPGSRPDGW